MKVRSYGKINLSLDVISKRDDGYHNIKTIMQKISLYDELTFKRSSKKFILDSNIKSLCNEDNLIFKAYRLLESYCKKSLPIEVFLQKNLPIAAGIAGGTGNGAACLKALNKIYNLEIAPSDLEKISLKLGADFPYMLRGGTVLAQGIGERLMDLKDFSGVPLLIINPGYPVSTPEVYKNISLNNKRIDFDKIIELMEKRDIEALTFALENKMEAYVFKKHKELRELKDSLNKMNGAALMSGSGPTLFCLFNNEEDLNRAYNMFEGRYKYVLKAVTIGGDNEI
ncbi:4-(cytidine 5'-diphospho)-2-C-methyl-D-erythritol kinase [Peptoniphilus catoniae]|uniref:4-(cytidine 5'-diphospho)-2-C-methyl-D-erythritol kinase n=1 Tax=Peptoniphilus catoniae TaxID=1660341 RepID=UPI001FE2B1A7|nr:4-(cytidine 5'-diphospho)-2-C-methyl-D-erythritol kinase [Peptoniphilus catoniae]